MDGVQEEWNELDKEYTVLSEQHAAYCRKVEELRGIQRKCLADIAHQRYRIKQLQDTRKKLVASNSSDKSQLVVFDAKVEKRKSQFRELEDVLPHENGIYLKIVLGSVNVSLLSKVDKFKYKEDYERFKLYVTMVNFALCLVAWLIFDSRVTDAMFQFLLVWYYCTLTIREHILKVNGSRIKGWWITHHFISTAAAGILLIWPDGFAYHEFRTQFYVFSISLAFIQVMQYYYQSGSLYRLRSLGEKRSMDLTVEGFQSWMWKGLSFLLPFLIFGYLFQLYNAYVLFYLSLHPDCTEWQVCIILSVLDLSH